MQQQENDDDHEEMCLMLMAMLLWIRSSSGTVIISLVGSLRLSAPTLPMNSASNRMRLWPDMGAAHLITSGSRHPPSILYRLGQHVMRTYGKPTTMDHPLDVFVLYNTWLAAGGPYSNICRYIARFRCFILQEDSLHRRIARKTISP